MGIADPDALSDIEWSMRYKELLWIRTKEAEANKIDKNGKRP